jgi:predicted O-methyltransferase YrrM
MESPDYFLDPSIEEYAEMHTSTESPLLSRLNRETHLRVMYPRMLSGRVLGKFLEMISIMVQPSKILEVGTYTGYSAICLAKGLKEGGVLYTIEVNEELEGMALRYFELAGLQDEIRMLRGNALDLIPGLEDEFDLVFLDAGKEEYLDYYQLVFDKVKKGGYILADNALWDGRVLNPDNKESRGIAAFNDYISQDRRVEHVLLTIRDGLMLIRKC